MSEDVFDRLANAERAFVVAAAGCGKTHAIAQAVARSSGKPQLILTHTHAGVAALRRRLLALSIPRARYVVETIAGWACKVAASYPVTSGLPNAEPSSDADWTAINPAAKILVGVRAIRRVLQASYGGVYVDEYQDCIRGQHDLILAVAEILPCRVLGDPLQGIFDFTGEAIKWKEDVESNFVALPEMVEPWRWRNTNPALAGWLKSARQSLIAGEPLSLEGAPLAWRQATTSEMRKACYDSLQYRGESVVALYDWPGKCHGFARDLGGKFKSIEPMECPDLIRSARAVEAAKGQRWVLACIKFASDCLSNLGQSTATLVTALKAGRIPRARKGNLEKLYDAAAQVAASGSYVSVKKFLLELRKCRDVNLYRDELWHEMLRSVDYAVRSEGVALDKAAWHVRNITRQIGRSSRQKIVARTLLVKGLEFDHTILLDADQYDRRNLYVALTRASKSVTVLSQSTVLTPVEKQSRKKDVVSA